MELKLPLVARAGQLSAADVSVTASRAKVDVSSVEEIAPTQVNGKVPIFLVFNRLNVGTQRVNPVQEQILRWMVEALKEGQMITVVTLDMGGHNIILQPRVPARIALLAIERYNNEAHLLGGRWQSGHAAATPEEEPAVNAALQSLRVLSTPHSAPDFITSAHVYAAELSALAGTLARFPGRKPMFLIEQLMPFVLDETEGKLRTGLNMGVTVAISGGRTRANGMGVINDTHPDLELTAEMQRAIERLNEAHVSIYRVGMWMHSSEPNSDYLVRATAGLNLDNPFDLSGNVRTMMKDFGPYYIAHVEAATPDKMDWHPLSVKARGEKLSRAPLGFFSVPVK